MKKISNKKMILLVVISFLMTFCLSLTISSYAKYSTELSNVRSCPAKLFFMEYNAFEFVVANLQNKSPISSIFSFPLK